MTRHTFWGCYVAFLLICIASVRSALGGLDVAPAPLDLSQYVKQSQLPLPAVIPGTFTIATLPAPTANQARYAFVTDLGGGADMVLSDGTNWKHIRQGVVTTVPLSSNLVLTPLASPPITQLSGNALTGVNTITVSSTNLYPGYTVRIITPSGVLSTAAGLVGSLGITASGIGTLPLVAGTWEDVQYNGSALVEIAKGTL